VLLKPNTGVERGTVVNPDGSVATRPTIMFTDGEAALLRAYKTQILEKYHLREALYCNDCWTGDREDGTQSFVQSDKIGVICRCTTRLYFGSSF